MKLIATLVAGPLAVLAFTAGVYHGDRVTINFPDGWSAPDTDTDGIITSRGPGDSGVNCNIQLASPPDLAKSTAAEINETYNHAFDIKEWADFLGLKQTELTVIESEVRTNVEGDSFHIATLHVKTTDTDAMVRYGFFIAPSRVTMAGCYVVAQQFATYSTLFDQTITSLRPR